MQAREFWDRLERRVCDELDGIGPARTLGLWCDGFIPEINDLDEPTRAIAGRVYLGFGRGRQECWRFELRLDQPIRPQTHGDWSTFLPPDGVTRWLTVDVRGRCLTLEPAVAVPDRPARPGR